MLVYIIDHNSSKYYTGGHNIKNGPNNSNTYYTDGHIYQYLTIVVVNSTQVVTYINDWP